jgi:hypothetical protein
MKKDLINKIAFDDHLGCLGNFKREGMICRRFCALRIRCAIEYDQNRRLEFLEDLVTADEIFMKIQ